MEEDVKNEEDIGSEEQESTSEQPAEPAMPIDFTTFILSLSSSAAFHLGLTPHPESKTNCANLPMAKQTIDILGILQEKTIGNLTGEEERLLGEVLYNLRMAFVSESSKCQSQ